MNFDRSKAMRNAERYVAQGKLKSAISEYRAIVDADPRDVTTLNMLGDLYVKNANKREAVDCYMRVAEHYSTQGFAQKAIAVYNKVSRLQPDSIEVTTKLAELYTIKGSLNEARSHYTTLAEHYEKTGHRIEALAMWKQISLLDPNNTEVCMSLAESYLREGQHEAAAEAYAEAGARFARKGKHEEAITAFSKGLDIRPSDLRLLTGFVESHAAIGRAGRAVSVLEEIIEEEPYNRDVLFLLIDCHISANNIPAAERSVIKLVEIEPANYPKLLDILRIYLNANDLDGAGRILSMSAEYFLAAGQGDECRRWINEILERDPEHIQGLRLLVSYAAWLKEERTYIVALDRLAKAASKQGALEDERYALAHLTILKPHETLLRVRLDEINEQLGGDIQVVENEFIKPKAADRHLPDDEEAEPEAVSVVEEEHSVDEEAQSAISIVSEPSAEEGSADGEMLSESAARDLDKEAESITFYIENGYFDLAEKTIQELAEKFGETDEVSRLRDKLAAEQSSEPAAEMKPIGIDEMRSEFGLDENDVEAGSDGDFDTHFQTAVAYQEMGLYEQAIGEFQDAIKCLRTSDNTRRFFACANLLGHCFISHDKPNHAVTWFLRALETEGLGPEEKQGLWYELAAAYEASGDIENAARYFDAIYAENVEFRDVAERVRSFVPTM